MARSRPTGVRQARVDRRAASHVRDAADTRRGLAVSSTLKQLDFYFPFSPFDFVCCVHERFRGMQRRACNPMDLAARLGVSRAALRRPFFSH